jgi:hypothetical protein
MNPAKKAEDVVAALQVGTEHFLVVAKSVTAFSGQKEGRHGLQAKLAMVLLEDGAHVDHRVDIRQRRRVPPNRRVGRVREKVAQSSHPRGGCSGILRIGEGENPPAAVRLNRVAQMNRLGIGQTNDRRRMETHADHEALCQLLMHRFARDDRRLVFGRRSRRVASEPDEIFLDLRRIGAFASCIGRRLQGRAQQLGPFPIEVDQFLGDGLAFLRVGMQNLWRAPS